PQQLKLNCPWSKQSPGGLFGAFLGAGGRSVRRQNVGSRRLSRRCHTKGFFYPPSKLKKAVGKQPSIRQHGQNSVVGVQWPPPESGARFPLLSFSLSFMAGDGEFAQETPRIPLFKWIPGHDNFSPGVNFFCRLLRCFDASPGDNRKGDERGN